MTFHPAANYSIHTQCWSNWERSQRDNFPLSYCGSKPWADFHPCFTGVKITARAFNFACISRATMPMQDRRKQDPPDLKGSFWPSPPLLPPAQLQVKGAQRPQRKGWECRLSIITEITNNVPATFTFLTLLILPIQSRVSVAFVCWDYIHGSERVGISH